MAKASLAKAPSQTTEQTLQSANVPAIKARNVRFECKNSNPPYLRTFKSVVIVVRLVLNLCPEAVAWAALHVAV